MALDCRYQALAVLLALIDDEPWPEAVGPCDQSAVWSTSVMRKRDGQDVEIWTQTCDPHDRRAQQIPGIGKSMRLRQPKPEPSP